MRILHLLNHSLPVQDGYVQRTMGILRAQRSFGWSTVQVTSPKQQKEKNFVDSIDGWAFYRTSQSPAIVQRLPIIGQLASVYTMVRRLRSVIREQQPDIIHVHSPVLNAISALVASNKFRIPVVYEVRAFWEDAAVCQGTASELGLRYRLTRNLETFVFKRVNAIAAISEGLRSDIVDRGIPAEKVFLIPNGIETDEASSPVRPEILGRPEAPVLGYIGSLVPYEGLDLLLESLPHVLKRFPKMRVILVGGGPEGDRLKALAQSLNVEGSVEFVGPVKHEEVFQFYGAIDLLIYPRRSSRLTELVTPLKPLEAMAQGLPVLASDVGGHKELIDINQTGFLFRAGDMNDLVTRIIELLSDPSALRLVGVTARERVCRTRTWHAIVARYHDVYTRAMGQYD